MQQRQLRLGDILDDYCPRERRLTNHAVVAMVGDAVKQTRCTTCDTEHEYKQAKVPRQRRKNDAPAALYAQVAAGAPKRIAHEQSGGEPEGPESPESNGVESASAVPALDNRDVVPPASAMHAAPPVEDTMRPSPALSEENEPADDEDLERVDESEGPIHRRLIRASLPRQEGQQPPARPIPEFTIRQPAGRQNRFRPRHAGRGGPGGQQGQHGHQFGGNRSNGNMGGNMRGGGRPGGGGGGGMNRRGQQGGGGRKRSK